MQIEKAQESLRAAELCFNESLYNSTANRAYYAMFQAAVVALARAGIEPDSAEWSHKGLQTTLANQLIHRRKLLPRKIAQALPKAMGLRNLADYREQSVSKKDAYEVLQLATEFLRLVKGLPSL